MSTTQIFLSLIKSELWQEPLPREIKMDDNLFRQCVMMARKQTVDGLVVNSLIANRIHLSNFNAAEALVTKSHVISENDLVNKGLQDLCNLLSSHQIKFLVVKGQTLAALYPHPNYRRCGDIDFYVYPDYFDKAREVIESEWRVRIEGDDEDAEQHVSFTYHDVCFEMHFCLMKFASRRNQRVFDRLIAESELSYRLVGNVQVPVLEDELNLVYTFLHLYHHLIELGVGLRQFCDVAILMNHMKMDQAQKDRVTNLLRQLGFLKPFYMVESLLHKKLGLDTKKMLSLETTKDSCYESFVMDIVFKRGNFGKFGRKNAVRSGWKYNLEALGTKLRHYGMLFMLSPRENASYFLRVLPKRAFGLMKR